MLKLKKIANDNDNDHVVNKKFLFILSVIFRKACDKKKFNIDRMRSYFENDNDKS